MQKMQFGFGSTEQMAIDAGYHQIPMDELLRRTVGKTLLGKYQIGFVFVGQMAADGLIDGENNVGTRDSGRWSVNEEANTLSLEWHGSWFNSTTRAYDIEGELHFYDADTSEWRMSFVKIANDKQGLAL